MKHSAVILATTDAGVRLVLVAGGWTFTARQHTHCPACRDTPLIPPRNTN